METWIIPVITALLGVAASSGFWEWRIYKKKKNSAETRLLLGLAHDRILFLGASYIKRGNITKEEYDDLYHYLYEPYHDAGGNGSAEKIVNDCSKLPMCVPIYLGKEEYKEYMDSKGGD